MKYIDIPKNINPCDLHVVMRNLFREARARAKKEKIKMSFCGFEKRWTDCFSGVVDRNGEGLIVFYFNLGRNTAATSARVALPNYWLHEIEVE
jgi:hypothetical protein